MIDRYNCYGWDIRRGEMRCEDDGEYVRHSDYEALERQIAALRAKLSEARRQARDNGMELCRERSRAEAAEAENARLKALPLKDEVEWVLGQIADEYGITGTWDEKFKTAQLLASALLSRLPAGVQEGWRPMEDAPRDGTVIEAIYDGDFSSEPDKVFWQSEGRCCVLGSRAGAYKPGWTSIVAGNLPVDPPSHWRPASPSVSEGGSRG